MWSKYYHFFISVVANFLVLRCNFILNMLAGNESIKNLVTWLADVQTNIIGCRSLTWDFYRCFIGNGLKFVTPSSGRSCFARTISECISEICTTWLFSQSLINFVSNKTQDRRNFLIEGRGEGVLEIRVNAINTRGMSYCSVL